MTASEIRSYETKLIPGVLQTDAYATSIVTAYLPHEPPSTIERIVQARLLRAEHLLGPAGPKMWFMIDEAALRRGIGNERNGELDFSIMRRVLNNLRHLNTVGRAENGDAIEQSLNPNVSVQIVPFAIGAYTALRGPFEILEFLILAKITRLSGNRSPRYC